jgi:hypothetical protein
MMPPFLERRWGLFYFIPIKDRKLAEVWTTNFMTVFCFLLHKIRPSVWFLDEEPRDPQMI